MKILIYTGRLDHEEDFIILGDAKVKDVRKKYSLADLLKDAGEEARNGDPMNWGIITR